jgi:cobyrinic acid a,c-diamide synthase
LRSLGYRQVTLNEDLPLGPAGTAARGHEFHYSEIVRADEPETAVNISARTGIAGGRAGFHKRNVMAGYVHLHFGSNPDLARNLVEFCRTHPIEEST